VADLREKKKEKKKRKKLIFSSSAADFFGFFFHAIPEERGSVLTLPELHELVSDVWLTRHDAELEEERAARRKGRPKSTKERKLEEVKLREAEEYRTGMGEQPVFLVFFLVFFFSRRCDSGIRGTGLDTSRKHCLIPHVGPT